MHLSTCPSKILCSSKHWFIPIYNRPDNSGIHVSVICNDSTLTPSVQALLRHNAPSLSLCIFQLENVRHPSTHKRTKRTDFLKMELQLITDPFERLLYFSLYFFTIHYCVTVVHVDQVFADDITVFSWLTVHLFSFPAASSPRPWPRSTQCFGPASNCGDSHPENEVPLGYNSSPSGLGIGQDAW